MNNSDKGPPQNRFFTQSNIGNTFTHHACKRLYDVEKTLQPNYRYSHSYHQALTADARAALLYLVVFELCMELPADCQ
jgi:hypothetical protein